MSETLQSPTPAKLPGKIESKPCGRCGGSGKLDVFSHVYGGTCFKCGGAGHLFTKRGRLTSDFLTFLRSKPAEQVKVGDVCQIRVGSPITGQRTVFRPCLESRLVNDRFTGGSSDSCAVYWLLSFKECANYTFLGHPVRMAQSAESKASTRATAMLFQDKLTKSGAVRKDAVLTPEEKAFLGA